jgi:hypothetical protein
MLTKKLDWRTGRNVDNDIASWEHRDLPNFGQASTGLHGLDESQAAHYR